MPRRLTTEINYQVASHQARGTKFGRQCIMREKFDLREKKIEKIYFFQ